MIEADEHPVHGDDRAVAALRSQADELDTVELTTYASTLGLLPPDDRPDWFVVREYGPDGEERGLFWVGPDDE